MTFLCSVLEYLEEHDLESRCISKLIFSYFSCIRNWYLHILRTFLRNNMPFEFSRQFMNQKVHAVEIFFNCQLGYDIPWVNNPRVMAPRPWLYAKNLI